MGVLEGCGGKETAVGRRGGRKPLRRVGFVPEAFSLSETFWVILLVKSGDLERDPADSFL